MLPKTKRVLFSFQTIFHSRASRYTLRSVCTHTYATALIHIFVHFVSSLFLSPSSDLFASSPYFLAEMKVHSDAKGGAIAETLQYYVDRRRLHIPTRFTLFCLYYFLAAHFWVERTKWNLQSHLSRLESSNFFMMRFTISFSLKKSSEISSIMCMRRRCSF